MTKKRWTLSQIKAANEAGGYFFFSPNTMRHFGDTMKSFKVQHRGDDIYVVRVKPMRGPGGLPLGGVGERRKFYPDTGKIGLVIGEGEDEP